MATAELEESDVTVDSKSVCRAVQSLSLSMYLSLSMSLSLSLSNGPRHIPKVLAVKAPIPPLYLDSMNSNQAFHSAHVSSIYESPRQSELSCPEM